MRQLHVAVFASVLTWWWELIAVSSRAERGSLDVAQGWGLVWCDVGKCGVVVRANVGVEAVVQILRKRVASAWGGGALRAACGQRRNVFRFTRRGG